MSFIVPSSIVVLVNRQRIYFTVYAKDWSDECNYLFCNVYLLITKRHSYGITSVQSMWKDTNLLQDLADILYKAAGDGNVDPHKVEQILGVPPTSTMVQEETITGRLSQIHFFILVLISVFSEQVQKETAVWIVKIFTARRRSCGKVMFSDVCLSVCQQRRVPCDYYPWSIWPIPLALPSPSRQGEIPATDIRWPSPETFSNVFTWRPTTQ